MSSPSPNDLRALLHYEPTTGKLFWKARGAEWFTDNYRSAEGESSLWNSRNAGKEAFTADNGDGYRCGRLFGRKHYAHRVVWAILHGGWPDELIDHIDGCRSNNRPENLRSASTVQNTWNRTAINKNNSSGFRGVSFSRTEKKWRARIGVNNATVYLGFFASKEAAAAAYAKASAELHGKWGTAE